MRIIDKLFQRCQNATPEELFKLMLLVIAAAAVTHLVFFGVSFLQLLIYVPVLIIVLAFVATQ